MRLRAIPPADPAERYLLALLAREPAEPPARDADWRRLLDLAVAHRVAEHLYARRLRGGWWQAWPAAARAELRHSYVQSSLRNERYREELLRLLPALGARDITPVLLKGAALNLTVCGDPAERSYGDVDLLVRRSELDGAAAVLRDLGYALDVRYQSEQFYRNHHYHLIFRRPDRPWLCFEVHWDLTLPMMDAGIDAGALRARAEPASLNGLTALVPAPEDLLLHLSLHAAVNAFGRLGQVLDVATVAARRREVVDAARLWARAREWRVAAPLQGSLALAPLFGPCPEARLLLAAGPGTRGSPLARALLRPVSLLRQRPLRSAAGATAIALWRRDRERDRWRYLARQFVPSTAEIAMDGHPSAVADGGRLPRPLRGASVALRATAWALLALAGWEVEPRGVSGLSANEFC